MRSGSQAGGRGRALCRRAAGGAALCVAMLAGAGARGESWTNVVGHTLEAQFVECVGRFAVFRQADGSRIRMPVGSLCAADRQRVAALAHPASGSRRAASESAPSNDPETRARSLHAAGRLSDADLAEVLRALKTAAPETPR